MISSILSFLSGDVNNLNIQFLNTLNLNFLPDTLFKYSIIIFCLIYILDQYSFFFLYRFKIITFLVGKLFPIKFEVFRKHMFSPYFPFIK